MSRVFVRGIGAVSPAGWGVTPLREALESGREPAVKELARPGLSRALPVRQVPAPPCRPPFLGHPRLRRASPISHYAVAAAMEALGEDIAKVRAGSLRLGIILCVMSGCVNYSRRFYDETLRDPTTASPLVFPETVFNAPSSHLAALLGTTAVNYTLVGDPGTFLQGVALAAEWLTNNLVDGCLVVGAEEMDWLTADAFRLFAREIVVSDGSGALYFQGDAPGGAFAELATVTDGCLFSDRRGRVRAAQAVASQLSSGVGGGLLCDGLQRIPLLDQPEVVAWKGWSGARLSPKIVLGEGLMAAAAWQCVAAVDALSQGKHRQALVSVAGCNQQVIGARFVALPAEGIPGEPARSTLP